MKQRRIVILIFIVIALLFSIVSVFDGGDFDVYLNAALRLKTVQNIYAPPFLNNLQYCYSPFFAFILIPFSQLQVLCEVLWGLLSFFLLYRIWTLTEKHFNLTVLSQKQYRLWVFFAILLSFQFIKYNISLIQLTIFLLWAGLESLELFSKNKYILGAFVLALAISIKIMPIVLVPYLVYRKYFKETGLVVLFSILFMFVPALFLGLKFNNYLLTEWWHAINPTSSSRMLEGGIGSHGIVALVPVYLSSFTNNIGLILAVENIVRAFFIVLSVLFFRTLPFKRETNKLFIYWEASYLLLVIPLIFPQQMKYEFLFALPVVIYLLYYFISKWDTVKQNRLERSCFVLFSICMLLYSPLYGSDILGRHLFDLSQYFRFLTISTILLIPISLLCNPKKLAETK